MADTRVENLLDQQIDTATGLEEDAWPIAMEALYHMSRLHDVLPGWWSKARDNQMRNFWKDGERLSSVMYTASVKLANIPLKFVPEDMTFRKIAIAERLTETLIHGSGFMGGFTNEMTKFAEDFLGQDNGAFLQILADGPVDGPIEGPVLGLRHLDSAHVRRTRHPKWPIIWTGDFGNLYKVHWSRVIMMSQQSSSHRFMNGVGYCSVSRAARTAHLLMSATNYALERAGSRAANQILVGSGISASDIVKALSVSERMMDDLNLKNWARTVVLGGQDIDLNRIPLSNMDSFNQADVITYNLYAIALAFGLEFNEVLPLVSGRSSDNNSLQRSRGKLPLNYIRMFTEQAAVKLAPPGFRVEMHLTDEVMNQQLALVRDINSRASVRQLETEQVTTAEIQQQMLENEELTLPQYIDLARQRGVLGNGLPLQTVYFDERYSDLISIDRSLLIVEISDPSVARAQIQANQALVYSVLGNSPSRRDQERSKDVLAALDWLDNKYTFEPDQESEDSDQEIPRDGQASNDEQNADDRQIE